MTKVLLTFALIATVLTFMPAGLNAAPTTNALSVPIVGTLTGPTGTVGSFVGTFNLTGFALQNGKLVAVGIVTGTATNTVTGVVSGVLQTVTAAITGSSGSCTILHLVIGPISLDLLGLQITTNQIVVDITAQPGPGNLLGNLLCDIANLLNNPGQELVRLLNEIVGILRGL